MNEVELLAEIFELAATCTEYQEEGDRKGHRKFYDPGKHNSHFEKVEDGIYGMYSQTYDSPEGDIWEAWLISIRKGGMEILAHKSGERFYDDKMFKEWLGLLPYSRVK
jgi:hypothetical protein